MNVDRRMAGRGGEAVGTIAERGADRDGAHDQGRQRVGIAGEPVDAGAEVERNGRALEAGLGDRRQRRCQRIDGDHLGRGRGGAEVALRILRGRGDAQREVGIVGRRDGEPGEVPGVNVDRRMAGRGGEAVGAIAERGADRDGAHDQGRQRVGIAGEPVDAGAEVERNGRALEAGLGDRRQRRCQRIDGDHLGRGRGGAEVALRILRGRGDAQREVGIVGRRDGEPGEVPGVNVDRRMAGRGGEAVGTIAERGADRDGAHDQGRQRVGIAGEPVDAGAEVERNGRALEAGLGDRRQRRCQRIDGDHLGRGRGGAEVALRILRGRGDAQREVGIVGRRDGEPGEVPGVNVDRRMAGRGGEAVGAIAERGADRDGAHDQGRQRVGIAGEPVDAGAEVERNGRALEAGLGDRRQRRCQRIDGDHLGRARGGAEVALRILRGRGDAQREVGIVGRRDGEPGEVPGVNVDRRMAGRGGEAVGAIAERGADRDGAHDQGRQRVGIAGEPVDAGAEVERNGRALEAGLGDRRQRRCQRIDRDHLGRGRGILRGRGDAQREVGIVGRRDGEPGEVPGVNVDRRMAGRGGEAVGAIAERGADRDGAHDQGRQQVGIAGEPVDAGAEVERNGRALEAGLGDRRQRRCQRIDGDHLGRGRGGAEVALRILRGRGDAQREVGIVGRRDGEPGEVPGVNVDRRMAGRGGEAVGAIAERGADRDGAHDQGRQRVGIAGEPVDAGAEVERYG